MVINLFRPKGESDVVEEFLRTCQTPLTIPAMLADARARMGERVVYQHKLRDEWHRMTLDEAWQQANDFAAGLIALGLQKGDRVAIICENGLPWAVGALGTFLAGGVTVPLYTELKTNEIEELVKRSGARIVIVTARSVERLGDHLSAEHIIVVGATETKPGHPPGFLRRGKPDTLPFDEVPALATPQSRAELARAQVEPDDLATIVFTSGTTGGMKGVMLTHKNLMSNVESARLTVQLEDRDRLVLVLPMHHAFPFILWLTATSVGGELTFENDLLRIRDRVVEVKPTLFLGVPALFDQLYRTIVRRAEAEGRMELFERGLRVVDVAKRRTGVNLGRLVFREIHQLLGGHIRFLLSGGAPLKPETALAFFRLGMPLLQGWGLSEAAPVVTAQRWNPKRFFFSNHYEEQVGTVGPPIPGVEVSLIDVPEKEIYVHLHGEGELVVRGPNVFAGYWQAPEDTVAAKAGEWLRTGDLGRIDEDGNIWITGRSKYIIVLDSGEKVVPDELEGRYVESELLQDICIVPAGRRGKAQVGAIVYPAVDAMRALLGERGEEVTEASVRRVVQDELDAMAKNLAPFKRVSEITLADKPLPKTALQDVARGQLDDAYSFDVERWQASAALPPETEPAAASEDAATTEQ